MSDQRLRTLERRYQETGAIEDEAAWLLERVRSGELEQLRLELCAYLSYKPAQAAVGMRPAGPSSVSGSAVLMLASAEWSHEGETVRWLKTFMGKLHKWGWEAVARGCVALGQVARRRMEIAELEARREAGEFEIEARGHNTLRQVPVSALNYQGLGRFVRYDSPRDLLEATEEWVLRPDDDTAATMHDQYATSVNLLGGVDAVPLWSHLLEMAEGRKLWSSSFLTDVASKRALAAIATREGPNMNYQLDQSDDAEIRDAVRKALIPWALGRSDPLQEWVDSRHRAQHEQDEREAAAEAALDDEDYDDNWGEDWEDWS